MNSKINKKIRNLVMSSSEFVNVVADQGPEIHLEDLINQKSAESREFLMQPAMQ